MNVLAPGCGGSAKAKAPVESTNLAPAFTPTEMEIGILGVRPRLQQRDCSRFTRDSSRRLQWARIVSRFNAAARTFARHLVSESSLIPLRRDEAYKNRLVDQLDVTNYSLSMESMLISEFKAKAIATLKKVRTRESPFLSPFAEWP